MAGREKIRIVYVTKSPYKKEENNLFKQFCFLNDGRIVGDVFDFDIRAHEIQEILDVNLSVMVSAEVVKAYSKLKVPCIVEHAGLVFIDYEASSYPGGLTKPMWDTLQKNFILETKSAGRKAIARAVVAYCDGKSVKAFLGERRGSIAAESRGARDFYWDTIFIPDDDAGVSLKLTYAEIAGHCAFGLKHKVTQLSQSTVAMKAFLEYRLAEGEPELWR